MSDDNATIYVGGPDVIASDDLAPRHLIVVLRDDELERIRQVVRQEMRCHVCGSLDTLGREKAA